MDELVKSTPPVDGLIYFSTRIGNSRANEKASGVYYGINAGAQEVILSGLAEGYYKLL